MLIVKKIYPIQYHVITMMIVIMIVTMTAMTKKRQSSCVSKILDSRVKRKNKRKKEKN